MTDALRRPGSTTTATSRSRRGTGHRAGTSTARGRVLANGCVHGGPMRT